MNDARDLDYDSKPVRDPDGGNLIAALRHSAEEAQSKANKYANMARTLQLLADQEEATK